MGQDVDSFPAVSLHTAFSWICEDCGKRNFCRGVSVDQVSEDMEEELDHSVAFLRSLFDDDDISGGVVLAPATVTCDHCVAKFRTE